MLSESTPRKRREWIAAIGKIESLKPRAVIAGHKRPGNEDSPRILEETRQYIRDFDRIADTSSTAREIYDQMLRLNPLGMNINALWTSALAIKANCGFAAVGSRRESDEPSPQQTSFLIRRGTLLRRVNSWSLTSGQTGPTGLSVRLGRHPGGRA